MTESSTLATPAASAESLTSETNWSPIIRAELESIGWTIKGIPDHLDRVQAETLLLGLKQQAETAAAKRKGTHA